MSSIWLDLGALAAAVTFGLAVLYAPGALSDRTERRKEAKAEIRAYRLMPKPHNEFTCPVCCRVMCRDCEHGGSHYPSCTYETLGEQHDQ